MIDSMTQYEIKLSGEKKQRKKNILFNLKDHKVHLISNRSRELVSVKFI